MRVDMPRQNVLPWKAETNAIFIEARVRYVRGTAAAGKVAHRQAMRSKRRAERAGKVGRQASRLASRQAGKQADNTAHHQVYRFRVSMHERYPSSRGVPR